MTNSTNSRTQSDADTEQVYHKTNAPLRNLDKLHAIASVLFIRSEESKKEIWKGRQVLDRIAAIVGKTYAERGDAYKLADDEALMMIRDVLLDHDPYLINQTKAYRVRMLHKATQRMKRRFIRRFPNLPE